MANGPFLASADHRAPVLLAIQRTLARYSMLARGDRVLVAVSGGPDSIALLAALHTLGVRLEIELLVAHLNHGLRGADSDADEAVASEVAARFGLPFHSERLEGGALHGARGGLEQGARLARYAFFRRLAQLEGCRRIATGHTRDDQAETVLLRLLRGALTRGLAGIEPVRADGIIRPLIAVSRAEVLDFLDRHALPYRHDASNDDARFTRNRIRREVLPLLEQLNPRLREHLAALAEHAAAAAVAEAAGAAALCTAARTADGGLTVDRLAPLPLAVRCAVVRAWLEGCRGDLRAIGRAHIRAIADCVHSGRELRLPGGERVVNEHGALRWYPGRVALVACRTSSGHFVELGDAAAEPTGVATPATGISSEPTFSEVGAQATTLAPGQVVCCGGRWRIEADSVHDVSGPVDYPRDSGHALADADTLQWPLLVRTWRPGDRVQPLGMHGRHRKLSDLFIDRKVPRASRALVPVVVSGDQIVWVPGVVRTQVAAVTPRTSQVVVLRAFRV